MGIGKMEKILTDVAICDGMLQIITGKGDDSDSLRFIHRIPVAQSTRQHKIVRHAASKRQDDSSTPSQPVPFHHAVRLGDAINLLGQFEKLHLPIAEPSSTQNRSIIVDPVSSSSAPVVKAFPLTTQSSPVMPLIATVSSTASSCYPEKTRVPPGQNYRHKEEKHAATGMKGYQGHTCLSSCNDSCPHSVSSSESCSHSVSSSESCSHSVSPPKCIDVCPKFPEFVFKIERYTITVVYGCETFTYTACPYELDNYVAFIQSFEDPEMKEVEEFRKSLMVGVDPEMSYENLMRAMASVMLGFLIVLNAKYPKVFAVKFFECFNPTGLTLIDQVFEAFAENSKEYELFASMCMNVSTHFLSRVRLSESEYNEYIAWYRLHHLPDEPDPAHFTVM